MNTHGIDIELPPLPEPFLKSFIVCANGQEMPMRSFDKEDMQAYATAAIEADRKHRGEIVVTKDDPGTIVAVTRQDSEGRILSVIAETALRTRMNVLHRVIRSHERAAASRFREGGNRYDEGRRVAYDQCCAEIRAAIDAARAAEKGDA